MERGDFLRISPMELKFPLELKKQSSCTLQLKNKTNSYVAFKVKATNPKKYCVRPCRGIVLPGKTCNVTVTMRAEKEFPLDMQCKDKFLVQSAVASTGATVEDITPEMFNKKSGKIKEFKLRVIYVLANLAGSSSRATIDDLGVSSKDLLSIHPTKLYFPFELNKQNSCHVQLTSKTEQYIAFKVKTTNPKKYCVRPCRGIVLPGKTCDVTVTMRAEKEFPLDMQCKDKFLVQSVVASTGATVEDITPEMFNKKSGKVEEFKLRAIYVPAYPPSPVPGGIRRSFFSQSFFVRQWLPECVLVRSWSAKQRRRTCGISLMAIVIVTTLFHKQTIALCCWTFWCGILVIIANTLLQS